MSDRPDAGSDPDDDSTSVGRAGQRRATEAVVSLTPSECWARLRTHTFGRLAVVVGGRPLIFPMNYAAGEDALVFRTERGVKLAHGPGSTVCLEIDDYDPHTATGWSVMVLGLLEDISEGGDPRSQALRKLPVRPLAPGIRGSWLALRVDELSGRYFRGGWVGPRPTPS
ncbi:MAG: pyridoxamine 5'-phosphate oxidase family protein [Chloroflexi bacterium]|nr:MAG: pyridoxamine 5'-phosphate oxidase family protein [Chloroflexota bacterium]